MGSQCSGGWAEQQALQQLEAQGWRLLDRKGEMLSQINQKVLAVQDELKKANEQVAKTSLHRMSSLPKAGHGLSVWTCS